MKYLPLLSLAFLSCAPLLTYNVPAAGSLGDIAFWISQNIEDDGNGKVDAPDVTAETRRGNCIDKALLCLAMARQGLGVEGEVILYQTPYGDHATARFEGFEYGYIEGSRQVGRPFSYRDAMGLIGRSMPIYVW